MQKSVNFNGNLEKKSVPDRAARIFSYAVHSITHTSSPLYSTNVAALERGELRVQVIELDRSQFPELGRTWQRDLHSGTYKKEGVWGGADSSECVDEFGGDRT